MLQWLRQHTEVSEERDQDTGSNHSIASLVNYLTSQIALPDHAASVLGSVSRFRSLTDEQQRQQLPVVYLSLEQYLVELDPFKKFLKDQLREIVKTRFSSLLGDNPDFDLVFHLTDRQETLLCQRLLIGVVHGAFRDLRGSRRSGLNDVAVWLQSIPEQSSLPIPFGLGNRLPQKEDEWVTLLRTVSSELYECLVPKLGEKHTAGIFEESYTELADRFMLLETFPVVIGLLPEALLSREKIGFLHLGRIRRVLSEKSEQLHEINEQLLVKNTELSKVRGELYKAKDELEVRVDERTAELRKANENLLAEIHERKRAEEALRASQEYGRNIINSSLDMIIAVDRDRKIIEFNKAAQECFGYSIEEVVGKDVAMLYADTQHGKTIHQSTVERGSYVQEVWNRRKNGEVFSSLLSASVLRNGEGNIIGFMGISRDITMQKKAEEELRKSEEKYRTLFEESNDVIFIAGVDGALSDINPAGVELLGYSSKQELLEEGKPDMLFLNAEDQKNYESALFQRGVIKDFELNLKKKDGRTVIVEISANATRDEEGNLLGYRGIMRDVTERRQLEQQLMQSQKLESIGLLAGGIAHDINNVLTPILMAVEMLREKFGDESSMRMLEMVEASAKRGADVVKQILTVARRVEGERVQLQPKHLVKEMAKIAAETFPKSIRVLTNVPKDLWLVHADATQLHQILLNLSVNARDAMATGGSLTISAENVSFDEHYAHMHIDAKPGPYVVLKVQDTGTGIPQEHLSKIFEPFFTTKGPGKGTGLGLSTVHAIVKNHQGFIDVASETGKGTEFKVFLPALSTSQSDQEVINEVVTPKGNGELILVVDDEVSILEITKATLERNGYRVLSAYDGTQAVAQYAKEREHIRLVLTDMSMPIMDGMATIRALQRIQPEVRIIAASGRMGHKKETEASGVQIQGFLDKPYTADKLLKVVHDVLTANVAPDK